MFRNYLHLLSSLCLYLNLHLHAFLLLLSSSWDMFGHKFTLCLPKTSLQVTVAHRCQLLFGLWSQLTMVPSSGFQPGFSLTAAHTALFHLALLVSRLCLVLFHFLLPYWCCLTRRGLFQHVCLLAGSVSLQNASGTGLWPLKPNKCLPICTHWQQFHLHYGRWWEAATSMAYVAAFLRL